MASSKREFANFKEFPGKIDHDRNLYEFPMLYKVADSGKTRQWAVYIRLIKEGSKNAKETKKQNWNMLEEDEVPIKDDYLEDACSLPQGIISELWTESGIVGGHVSRSAASYPKEKNVGRANYRNYFHQALTDARSKYLKKITEGSVEQKKLKNQALDATKDKLYFPMLARKYDDYADKPGKITYPLYIQNKINGNRCIIYLDVDDKFSEEKHDLCFKDVVMYTRQKKIYPFNKANDRIRKALLPTLVHYFNWKTRESIYLDGELYKHGVSLQSINSEIRGTETKDISINYWIYDCFILSNEHATFHERFQVLSEFYNYLGPKAQELIILTPTHLVANAKEGDKLFSRALKNKFEGTMYRAYDGIYMKSAVKKSTQLRSKDLLKRKPVYNDEFEIVDFTEGDKGTSKGAVVWICATKAGKTFKVTPNETNKERYKIFQECAENDGAGFIKKYKNRMIEIEYRDITDAGIPSHAKAILIRDYE